jgi:ADP-heptose:LPS heptosyltransferase
MSSRPALDAVLVHLASGIGNIVLATPLLALLARRGFTVDVRVDGDYPETAELLHGWGALRRVSAGAATQPCAAPGQYRAVLPAVPPFYWAHYAAGYRGMANTVRRPPDADFYTDEQAWYLAFAAPLGGPATAAEAPHCTLPIAPDSLLGVGPATLVLAPGCKGGEMAAKRWPHFAALAGNFADVAVVGTEDDLRGFGGAPRPAFPPHVRNLVDRLTLRQTAAALAAAGVVVANDSGIGHMAAALGVPTVLLFGPTPAATLGRFPPNVTVLHAGLPCAPCWFGARFSACRGRIDCLESLTPSRVTEMVHALGFGSGREG